MPRRKWWVETFAKQPCPNCRRAMTRIWLKQKSDRTLAWWIGILNDRLGWACTNCGFRAGDNELWPSYDPDEHKLVD